MGAVSSLFERKKNTPSHHAEQHNQENERKRMENAKIKICDLLCGLHANKSTTGNDDEFTIQSEFRIDVAKLTESVERIKHNESLKPYDTYHMLLAKMPALIVCKTKVNETEHHCFYADPLYYDVYSSCNRDQFALQGFLTLYLSVPDLVDLVLQYYGDTEFDLLFSAKYYQSGAMTLTDSYLTVYDALDICCTYSEKSGRRHSIKIGEQYDKALLIYLTWIIHELADCWTYRIFRGWSGIEFPFRMFMKYEIGGVQRPPPGETFCIVGECLVLMADGHQKQAKEIRAGDIVQTADGETATVLCTVSQRIDDEIAICRVGEGCFVTPEHPVRFRVGCKKWQIPYQMSKVETVYVEQVNNFVLDAAHHVLVDNVECITLAHHFSDAVVEHPVWGTDVIYNYLKSLPSFPDVVIHGRLNNVPLM